MIRIILIVSLLAACALPDDAEPTSQPVSSAPTSAPTPANTLEWLTQLADAKSDADKSRQLILVRAGAKWCGWCTKLDKEMEKKEARNELAGWTRVYIDVDRARRDAESLKIGPIPALRVLTPSGRVLASYDGFMPAEILVEWLKKSRTEATAAMELDAELSATAAPAAKGVSLLVEKLDSRDASIREAAIRRLTSHAEKTAVPVFEALRDGELATRLAAMEIFLAWHAPVDGLDPWHPKSLTNERLLVLQEWVGALPKSPTSQPVADLDNVEFELDRLAAATDDEAASIRERLVRHRETLRPLVLKRLGSAVTDHERTRLLELRYRLAASDALALDWPLGLVRLASTEAMERRQAADELVRRAKDADHALILELFADPDPVVRETSLRALSTTGDAGREALVSLLEDTDANVRTAVLKRVGENPSPSMTTAIVNYAKGETDVDLVVHALRVLRKAPGETAIKCLTDMLAHDSWQVRAESAEALAEILQASRGSNDSARAAAYAGLVKRLDDDDGFVVSRAFAALQGGEMSSMLTTKRIRKLIKKHPEMAVDAARRIAESSRNYFEAYDYGRKKDNSKSIKLLVELTLHADPEVRAVAVQGLCSMNASEA
ncbi:MAG: HEAT repeat domain-containing protein, partial [Planctomycetes bacterium]|nr:HEAT repeat domain-containing protein [Planctomycetota bacterium]